MVQDKALQEQNNQLCKKVNYYFICPYNVSSYHCKSFQLEIYYYSIKFWIPLKQVKEREKELAQQNQREQQNQELNSPSFIFQQQLDSPNLGYI